MRLFVGVVPPLEVVEHLAEFVEPRRSHPDEDLRWSSESTWHITLAFLGEVPDYKTDDLAEGLEFVAKRQKPIDLRLKGAGAFPGVPNARVLFTGVHDPEDQLAHLASVTRGAVNKAGVQVDGRKFTPHVTLARLGRPVDVLRYVRVLDLYEGPEWTATGFELISSRLGEGPSHGAAYDTVGEWEFLG
ncbi:RNA 2',3'-cyclic phosphodiesterase [Kribbella sp. NBC_01245]|uniref:RNA 2',3'-cyclic phosphodiesterase n=1 Tax=Kribbella sp. NBC_01245 TaxID=2903578 RepID=UPI002E290813|nr:RNA 2',3'-cyclic phosphodiesterase [Kribbella sp. NBC_01245]